MTEDPRALTGPAWVPCPHCENYLCLLHGQHAHECPCPEAEQWATSPYLPQRAGQG